jgi:predicted exporter
VAASIWFAFCVLTLSILALQLGEGFNLESSIISLLPEEEQDTTEGRVMEHFVEDAGSKIVFAFGDVDQNSSIAAASSAKLKFSSSDYFLTPNHTASDLQNALIELFSPYKNQLPSKDWYSLNSGKLSFAEMLRAKEKRLYLPTAAWNTRFIARDPLLMLPGFLEAYLAMSSSLQMSKGFLTFDSEGKTYSVVALTLNGNPFDSAFQKIAISSAQEVIDDIKVQYPGIDIRWSGIIRFAADGAQRMQGEVSLIGICSTLVVGLTLLICFRSVSYLALMLVPIGVGILFAFTYTHLLFGKIHWITLGFGASLIGISVDYTYHYLCDLSAHTEDEAQGVISRIAPGLSLGALSSLLGFAGLATAPLPGLRQMAVFACIGLLAAFFTVICVFPRIARRNPFFYKSSILSKASESIARVQSPLGSKIVLIILSLLLLCIAIGFSRIRSNDDIRLLQQAPSELVEMDKFIRSNLGRSEIASFIMVEGETEQVVLERQELLAEIFREEIAKGSLSGFEQLATFLPSEKLQSTVRESLSNNVQLHKDALIGYLKRIGVPATSFLKDLEISASQNKTLSYAQWSSSLIGEALSHLAILKTANTYVACVFLEDLHDRQELELAIKVVPGVRFVDRVTHISEALKRYRSQSLQAITISYCIAFLLLCFRYGPRYGPCIIVTPLVAAMSTLSLQALFGVPLTLFHVVATMLILGVGIDYAIFFHENRRSQGATFVAISLSAITTIASFGFLALSSSGVLQYIGSTVLIGIILCVLLSPLVLLLPIRESTHDVEEVEHE